MQIHIELPLNADVLCMDGVCGKSLELVIDPEDRQVTHLVVKENFGEQLERLVPIGMISGTSVNKINLCIEKQDLKDLDVFCERDIVLKHHQAPVHDVKGSYYNFPVTRQVVVESKAIPGGKLSFDKDTFVEAVDGRMGKLEKMLVHPQSEGITHMVVRNSSVLGPRECNVPISAIDRFNDNRIFLNLSKREVRELQQKVKSLP